MKKQSIYNKRWGAKNPSRVKMHRKKWGDSRLEQEVTRVRKWRRKNGASLLLGLAKYRAKKKGLPFNLTARDLWIPEYCPILGLKLERGVGRPHANSPSLDRVKPELGYVRGNVNVISHRANTLKGAGTLEEFEKIVAYLKWY